MPSGKSNWERSLAADRREAERRAKERAKQEKEQEKARKEAHLKAQQRKAEKKTAAVERQIEELGNVLTDALNVSPISFEQLMEPLWGTSRSSCGLFVNCLFLRLDPLRSAARTRHCGCCRQ